VKACRIPKSGTWRTGGEARTALETIWRRLAAGELPERLYTPAGYYKCPKGDGNHYHLSSKSTKPWKAGRGGNRSGSYR
jgi:hypothetical protein